MNWINELSWLWETLGIALIAAAVCVACAALICKKTNKKVLAVIGAAAFMGAILAVILIARTPMPI